MKKATKKMSDRLMKNIEWITINIANGCGFIIANLIDDPVKNIVVIIGVAALAWYNVERALSSRQERRSRERKERRENESGIDTTNR